MVVDIGANTGQFTITIHSVLPEALPNCYAALVERMAGQPNFAAINLALGEAAGKLAFERNPHMLASWFLRVTEVHTAAFPFTEQTQGVTAQAARLDDWAQVHPLAAPLMIKPDVQGYEDRVLCFVPAIASCAICRRKRQARAFVDRWSQWGRTLDAGRRDTAQSARAGDPGPLALLADEAHRRLNTELGNLTTISAERPG